MTKHIYASMQVFKYASIQVCKYASLHIFKYASMQVCTLIGLCIVQSKVQIEYVHYVKQFFQPAK